MSYEPNTVYAEDRWTDFMQFFEEGKFSECRAIQDAMGEAGFENDALRMHKMLNTKQAPTLEEIYGKEKVEWAQDWVEKHQDDIRDYNDRYYP